MNNTNNNKINNEGLKYLFSNNNLEKAKENIKKRFGERCFCNQKNRLDRLSKTVNLIKQGKNFGLDSDKKFYDYIKEEIGCSLETARGLIRRIFLESMTKEQIMDRDSTTKYSHKKSIYGIPIYNIIRSNYRYVKDA